MTASQASDGMENKRIEREWSGSAMKSLHGAEKIFDETTFNIHLMPVDTLLIARRPVDAGQHMLQKMGYIRARFNDRE